MLPYRERATPCYNARAEDTPLRILLVEDEPAAAKMLSQGLREQSYAVDVAVDGEEAEFKISISPYDLIVLDVVLPRKDGVHVCREMRAAGSNTPVLMLTARDAVEDRIKGLDAGADDYLTKPFEYGEFLARVRALLRRGPAPHIEVIEVADLRVEVRARRVTRGNKRIDLTAKEYALLEYLSRRSGELVNREEISEHVWDEEYDPCSNLIEVYMRRLRRKIDDDFKLKLLRTRRGEGYVLSSEEESDA
jgi:two-component system copper resistance phosphate regulon response regulator CusR